MTSQSNFAKIHDKLDHRTTVSCHFRAYFSHFIVSFLSNLSFQMAFIELFLTSLDESIITNRSKRYRPFIGFRRSLAAYRSTRESSFFSQILNLKVNEKCNGKVGVNSTSSVPNSVLRKGQYFGLEFSLYPLFFLSLSYGYPLLLIPRMRVLPS